MIRLLYITLSSTFTLSLGITLYSYFSQGAIGLEFDVYVALGEVFLFWFALLVNFILPIALFFSVKVLFNNCVEGTSLKLLACVKEENYIESIGYGNLIKVWRKWLLLIVWGSATFVLASFIIHYLLSGFSVSFSFFSIYLLYFFIALSGFFAIVFLASFCKQVRLKRC
ncbi:MAG: hypothetical protein JXQ67_02425 [Campylobacterales bacterium]|nr:hypothetical protein [Campylobacterales bacterium]